jgi:nucleotide-binding universal stress UspA family protein
MTHRIVVGVDGSPHSGAALRWALHEAAAHPGGEVLAVLAWQMPFIGNPAAFRKDEIEASAKELLLKSVAEATPDPPVPLMTVVAEGDPTESLLAAARDAAMLVVGIRGRSPFAGLMLGSVSQACAAHAPCPVVMVKDSDAPS